MVDSSCYVTSSFVSDSRSGYLGGIIGRCSNVRGDCVIESVVNMASVTFIGNTNTYNLWQGGIAGIAIATSKEITIKNCVNYGSIIHSGASNHVYIGGIAGCSESTQPIFINNCFNHGAIIENGTSNHFCIGGILGGAVFRKVSIENCVSTGKVNSITGSAGVFVGGVEDDINLTIIHSY